MANIRQYIGARYVFKIYENSQDPSSAEWESGVTYEPLTIVSYLNSTYASKKDVPGTVGDPASNPTYWIVTGAYNGQIADLQNQITAANGRIDTANGRIDTANGRIDDIDTRVDDIEDILSLASNKRVIVIADSYGTTGYNPQPFTFRLQTKLGLSNNDYFAYSEGSLGLVTAGSSGHTALTLLQAHENDITNHDTISDAVMTVGLNDYNQSESDITAAFNNLVTYLTATYPNAKIHWAFIGNSYTMTTNAFMSLYNTYNKLVNNSGNVYWAANTEYIMHNIKNMQSDGIHPNSDGSEVLASALAEYLKTGSFNYSVRNTASITFGSGTGTYTETIDNGVYSIVFNAMYNNSAFQIPSSNDPVLFGALSNNAIRGKGTSSAMAPAFTTDTNYQNPLILQTFVNGNGLYLKHLTGAAHTINGIQINSFNYSGLLIEA